MGKIKNILWHLRLLHTSASFHRRDSWVVSAKNLPKLTRNELEQIKSTWPDMRVRQRDMAYVRLMKRENGFSPYYINDYQMFCLLHRFNNVGTKRSLANKALYDIYLHEIPFPKTFLKCINGVLYDAEMNVLDYSSDILKHFGFNEVLIKPSVDSASGVGVKKINLENVGDLSKLINDAIKKYNGNFVIQELLKQHQVLNSLNESSINSCRVTSFYINGFYYSFGVQKVGKKGAIIDNWNSSYYVGVRDDGSLFEYGYDNNFNKVFQSDSGVAFKAVSIPNYQSAISEIKKYHIKYFPQIGIIGWDIIIDEKGNLVVIEANLGFPGVRGEQLCCGPVFENVHEAIYKKRV